MQTTKISLANIQGKLSRAEMKHIMAGRSGTCAAYMPTGGASGGPVVTYNISSADAQSYASSFAGGRWCCDSCAAASWYGI